MNQVFLTHSADETYDLGKKLAKKIDTGRVISLTGDLGAGKTTFVKGIASGLGIKDRITSPSFIIQNIHSNKKIVLYHFDLYRLGDIDQSTMELVMESFADPNGISIIEWGEKMKNFLPKSTMHIQFKHSGEDKRRIKINGSAK